MSSVRRAAVAEMLHRDIPTEPVQTLTCHGQRTAVDLHSETFARARAETLWRAGSRHRSAPGDGQRSLFQKVLPDTTIRIGRCAALFVLIPSF